MIPFEDDAFDGTPAPLTSFVIARKGVHMTKFLVWLILFIIWFTLGIPLGPGYPVKMG